MISGSGRSTTFDYSSTHPSWSRRASQATMKLCHALTTTCVGCRLWLTTSVQ